MDGTVPTVFVVDDDRTVRTASFCRASAQAARPALASGRGQADVTPRAVPPRAGVSGAPCRGSGARAEGHRGMEQGGAEAKRRTGVPTPHCERQGSHSV